MVILELLQRTHKWANKRSSISQHVISFLREKLIFHGTWKTNTIRVWRGNCLAQELCFKTWVGETRVKCWLISNCTRIKQRLTFMNWKIVFESLFKVWHRRISSGVQWNNWSWCRIWPASNSFCRRSLKLRQINPWLTWTGHSLSGNPTFDWHWLRVLRRRRFVRFLEANFVSSSLSAMLTRQDQCGKLLFELALDPIFVSVSIQINGPW